MAAQPPPQSPKKPPEPPAADPGGTMSGPVRLLHLTQQMRRSGTMDELLFLAVNEPYQIVRYDEALLFFDREGDHPVLRCISGLATFERHTPKVAWLEKHTGALIRTAREADSSGIFNKSTAPARMQGEWDEFLSAEAVLIPFKTGKTRERGFFLFTRGQPWQEKETKILSEIVDFFTYAYDHHKLKTRRSWWRSIGRKKKQIWSGAALACLAVLLFPVRETLVAEMEVTPVSPWIATAPLDGVIRKIHVTPNATVKIGDILFEMDDTTLRNEAILARERLEIARQELRQARQQAVTRPGATDRKADASLLELEVRKKENEARYNEEMLQRTRIFSGTNGIAVFGDSTEIEGKPVRTGEAIITVADPGKVELTVNMPTTDAIMTRPGDPVIAYLYASPFTPLRATIRYTSYKAQQTETPDLLAYKIKADLTPDAQTPRLGLKGTAHVRGRRTTLFYALFRKPIGYLRRQAGF